MAKINKKQQRIKCMVGIYNELNENPSEIGDGDNITYSIKSIHSILDSLKAMLKEEGVVGIDPKSKVNS